MSYIECCRISRVVGYRELSDIDKSTMNYKALNYKTLNHKALMCEFDITPGDSSLMIRMYFPV